MKMQALKIALESVSEAEKDLPVLYHISFDRKLPEILRPRQPYGSELQKKNASEEENIFAEFKTPRVSFSPSIYHCLQAVYPNTHQIFQSSRGLKEGVEMAVYRLDDQKKARAMTPTDLCRAHAVWDAHITKEHCFLDPVRIYFCGIVNIRVEKNIKGLMVHPFNEKHRKEIRSIIPVDDDVTFKQVEKIDGDEFRLKFF